MWPNPLSGFGKRRTLMLTPVTSAAARDAKHAMFGGGVPVNIINDSPGFIVQRVLATIVKIAANTRSTSLPRSPISRMR